MGGRYKVITYPTMGNTPYVKTDTKDLAEANESFKAAKDWNYTAVLYDAKDEKIMNTNHSTMDSKAVTKVLAGLSSATAVSVEASLTGGVCAAATAKHVYAAVSKNLGDGNALTKAIKLAVEQKHEKKEKTEKEKKEKEEKKKSKK